MNLITTHCPTLTVIAYKSNVRRKDGKRFKYKKHNVIKDK
jgi:hypothetical protein